MVMGDFNSSVGEGEKADVVGSFGYDRRNEKGQLPVDYCNGQGFVIRMKSDCGTDHNLVKPLYCLVILVFV